MKKSSFCSWNCITYADGSHFGHTEVFKRSVGSLCGCHNSIRKKSQNICPTALHFPVYLLTPWCRVLLEKPTGLQLVKKFPAFLWNPKFHYRTQKRPPPVPVLGQPNPVHIPTSHLLEIHPNITHPSTPRSPRLSLSLRFPHQDPIRPTLLTHTRHMPSPSHSRFPHLTSVIILSLNAMYSSLIHLFK